MLGSSWLVTSAVISRVAVLISPIIRGLITLLMTIHEPASAEGMFTEDVETDPIEAMHQNKSLVLGPCLGFVV